MEAKEQLRKVLDMPVRVNEFGQTGVMHVHCWFNYMQHIASVHAEEIGFGLAALKEKGFIWVLSRVRLHIEESPAIDDIMRVETYPNGVDRLFAKRQFRMTSLKSGRILGYASSYWLVVDMATQRLKTPGDVGVDTNLNADLPDFFPVLGRIASVDAKNLQTRRIAPTCIDLNQHLNNAYYCQYGADWLADNAGDNVSIREVQINFNHAVKAGETLSIGGIVEGKAFSIEGQAMEAGKNAFQMEGMLA